METLIINPIKKRKNKMAKKRKKTAKKTTRRRRTKKIDVFGNVIYSFLGLTAATLINQRVPYKHKWLISAATGTAIYVVGKRVLKQRAAPIAIGFGIAGLMNLASKTKFLKGTFSNFVGCSGCLGEFGEYIGYAPGQGYGYSPVDAGSEQDLLEMQYSDYWLDPYRAGVSIKDIDFIKHQ